MAAKKETTQDEPTKARPVDDDGNVLDEHGLPISGPARAAALKGKQDPALTEEVAPAPAAPAEGQ